jgi:RNA polymerase sigma factor (sigma-70 family)
MLIDTPDIDFERLYAENAQGLFGFLAYRVGERELAEEILAEAFERALRSSGGFDPRKASARTWLYTIALNCLRDRRRRAGAEERALQRAVVGARAIEEDAAMADVGDRDLLQRAMKTLSQEERDAIALRYGGELTAPEIADLLGEKLTTVEGRVYRALRKLRACLS